MTWDGAAVRSRRRAFERIMRDACLIERPRLDEDGNPVREMDDDTLQYVNVFDPVHEGRCRVQRPSSTSDHPADAGEFQYGVESLLAQLPIGVTGIQRGDRLTITAINPLSDPDLLGVVATVRANLTKTHSTKRTLICEEVS